MDTYTLMLVVVSTLMAGLAMPAGALLARAEHIRSAVLKDELHHGMMAFGGGALLSAIALVLVPEGIESLEVVWVAVFFVAGGISFMCLDIILKKLNTPASQLAAMLSDFIPESIALGAAFSTGESSAFLLAGLITLQNFPEGFNAYNELRQRPSIRPRKVIIIFLLMSLLGPIAGVSGFIFLAESPQVVGAIMLFASGGILYSIFQDIAPEVKLEKHWAPPLGAIMGFLVGMIGFMLTT
jgi:ZIP family zinc transporter